jgi:hypothetical protein
MTLMGQRFAYRERAHTPGDPERPVEVGKEDPRRSQKVRGQHLPALPRVPHYTVDDRSFGLLELNDRPGGRMSKVPGGGEVR